MTALMNKFKCLTTLTLTFCMLQLKFLSLFALMSIHNNFYLYFKITTMQGSRYFYKNSRTRAHFCSPTNFVCFWSAAKRKHKHERNFFSLFWKWKFSQYSRPSNVFLLLLLHVVVDVLRSIECDFLGGICESLSTATLGEGSEVSTNWMMKNVAINAQMYKNFLKIFLQLGKWREQRTWSVWEKKDYCDSKVKNWNFLDFHKKWNCYFSFNTFTYLLRHYTFLILSQ